MTAEIKQRMIAGGLMICRDRGLDAVTGPAISKMLDISHSYVNHLFDGAEGFRNAVAEEAVKLRDPDIIPCLIAAHHPAATALSQDERVAFLLAVA